MSSQKKPVLVMSELGNKRSEKKANFPAFLSEWVKAFVEFKRLWNDAIKDFFYFKLIFL
jgi:hypothetical protein